MARTIEGELEASEIETAGIVTDELGNVWTLPTDLELGEDIDFAYSPLDLPKKDPRFHYQFVKTDKELAWAISERFVPVRRSEVGLYKLNDANRKLGDYGVNPNSDENPVHTVGDLTLVKIPMQFREMRLKRAHEEADRVKASIEPPRKSDNPKGRLREGVERDGQKLVEDVVSRAEIVRPKHADS